MSDTTFTIVVGPRNTVVMSICRFEVNLTPLGHPRIYFCILTNFRSFVACGVHITKVFKIV